MGCDIHVYREKFIDGKWVTADEWEDYDYGDDDKGRTIPYEKRAYRGRHYDLFGLISKGVRRDFDFAIPPRGVAFDACPEYAAEVGRYGGDGHSHSYLYLHELRALRKWLDAGPKMPIPGMMEEAQLSRLQAAISSGNATLDMLYPYCGWTNAAGHVDFSVEMPMGMIVGDALDEIIASFDGIEGENHRLSFYFDN